MTAGSLSDAVLKLLDEQMLEWPVVGQRFAALRHVRIRKLTLSAGCHVLVQYNPDRIRSSAADVSPEALKRRTCFLCAAGRDPLQRSMPLGDYTIQVNPFPIFPAHFTVTFHQHVPQRVLGRFGDFLRLLKVLDRQTLFYNGPHCGASAPDHCHFQACTRGMMPLEQEWQLCPRTPVESREGASLERLENYFRTVFLLRGTSPEMLRLMFDEWIERLPVREGEQEPRMNLIGFYERGEYIVFLLPRNYSRPRCFYADDESRRTISPASVEMGGLFITPIERDFRMLSTADVIEILDECSLRI